MSTRMLIDARHPEETRVTVVKGSRVEDFDYESATRRQLKGNIYLARITRVEPSLQAAFVEYGGNRHGFLAFSEIHPDYYQIPLEDREAIIEAETQAAAAEKAAEDDEETATKKRRPRRRGRKPATEAVENKDAEISEEAPEETQDGKDNASATSEAVASEGQQPKENLTGADADSNESDTDSAIPADSPQSDDAAKEAANASAVEANADDVEAAEVKESEEDEKDAEIEAVAESRRRNIRALKRRYSIQEVIKRRQVLLIQVVKEERGNKGAALTTYMSLAGRYCVLMPNSTHSGGISRKISNLSDRKKLKQVINSLDVQEGMGLIVRTAGINRTKAEIKRDYDYLLRLWNGIRELTLKSTAPALIYEEGSLIKRTIRDVYTRDIDEVWVEGERGYRAAKDFMKLLMPSHAKKVQNYKDRIPLYQRYQVEDQLEAMYQPVVQLKSGGYIVINPTEALISIDVNSGRATKESNIEETAVKTNLEAAEEVARQLRLRDMAGLVVIDYIDMEDRGNNRAVERRMKDVLKSDRARIQVGRISSFGLMEMSRQRLRPNLLEVAMETCSQCAGTGLVRSVESAAIMVLRQLEEEGIRNRSSLIRAKVCPDVAVYLLNQKRAVISALEQDYKVTIHVIAEVSLAPSDIEITHENNIEAQSQPRSEGVVVKMDHHVSAVEEDDEDEPSDKQSQAAAPSNASADDQDDQPRKKRRRRRRRRRGGSDDNETSPSQETGSEGEISEAVSEEKTEANADDARKSEGTSRRRRGSRGGRRRRGRDGAQDTRNNTSSENGSDTATEHADEQAIIETTDAPMSATAGAEGEQSEKPVRRRRRVKKPTEVQAEAATDTNGAASDVGAREAATGDAEPAPAKRPTRRRASASAKSKTSDSSVTAASDDKVDQTSAKPAPRTRRKSAKDVTEQSDKAEAAGTADKKPEAPKKREASSKSPESKSPESKSAESMKPEAKTADPTATENSQAKGATAAPADADKKSGWWQRTFG